MDAGLALFQANNRAFKYGDGLFETIRVFEGRLPFLDFHFNRLKKGMQLLKFDIPDHYTSRFFASEIQKLIFGKGNHRVRLTVFRSAGGFYTPNDNRPLFLIETSRLEDSTFNLNTKGLKIGLFDEIKLSGNLLSNLKTCNSLSYVLAGIYAKENGFDDCILVNNSGNVAECTSSNIFILNGKNIKSPALSEACVEGTLRSLIIGLAQNAGFQVAETKLKIADIKKAEEVWLSNAIQGIRWVEKFDNVFFKNKIANQFVKSLNEKINLK